MVTTLALSAWGTRLIPGEGTKILHAPWYIARKINKHLFVWVGNFLFGGFGVDRFLRGQIGLGIVKLLFGWLTLGIWYLVDWIVSITKAYGDAYGNTEDITFDKNGNYTR